MDMRKCGWALLAGLSCLGAGSWALHDPQHCLDEFMYGDGNGFLPEAHLLDPLIRCLGDIEPSLIQAIKDPGMPRRRYALLYLEFDGGRRSVPLLRSLVSDENEGYLYRSDALGALQKIAPEEALRLAERLASESGMLGESARRVLNEETCAHLGMRSWPEAFAAGLRL